MKYYGFKYNKIPKNKGEITFIFSDVAIVRSKTK